MTSDSLPPQAYSIREGDDGYQFTTEFGATYWVYFSEADGYAPSASFAQNLKMFGFERMHKPYTRTREGEDTRLRVTIFEILFRLLSTFPKTILLYVCSDESVLHDKSETKIKHPRFAKKRSEIFAHWFNEWQKTGTMRVEKIDFDLYGQLYASCFFKSGNRYEVEIRQVIIQTIAEKL